MYKYGATLATVPVTSTMFVPTSTQWLQQPVSLIAYSGMPKVRIKFQAVSDAGNNVYVDDINLTGIVGVEEISAAAAFNVYPNPSNGNIFVSFVTDKETEAEIIFTDALGRTILSLGKNKYPAGENSIPVENYLSNGIYFVLIKTKDSIQTKRVVMMKD